MTESELLAERFEEHRGHLRAVAYRMLGSSSEADDAVQEAWLRLNRSDPASIESLRGWLTTVVARICLGMLRGRRSRGEQPLGRSAFEPNAAVVMVSDPEQDALLADSLGVALLIVLDALTPSERIAFVLHDMFGVPFDEIASVIDRSPEATRQLASRARRRVHGAPMPGVDLDRQRQVVDAFLAASRRGDFDGLLALLDPDIVLRVDATAAGAARAREVHGAVSVAKGALAFSHAFSHDAALAQPALVDGMLGFVAPRGQLLVAVSFIISDNKITEMHIVADPASIRGLDFALLDV
jgi:RNA polymerase sigma-70 factor (ECF subfamily)